MFPTCEVNACIRIPFWRRTSLAIAPATQRAIVSRADERPPPVSYTHLLDNFNIENTKKAVEMVAGRYELESSGGITFATLRDYAECGVDYISVGALTHSVKGLDMSFKAC